MTIGTVIARERKTGADAQARADAWIEHRSPWVRRIAMLHQLGWRLETDEARLFRYARTLAPESDVFVRKAIGWALRDYAHWNPAAVSAFLAAHRDHLSALTVREAGKRGSLTTGVTWIFSGEWRGTQSPSCTAATGMPCASTMR